jgi:hypothetical protein
VQARVAGMMLEAHSSMRAGPARPTPNAQRRVVLLLASDALVHACPTSSHLGGNNYCQIIISHSKSIVLIIHIYGLCPNPNLHKFNRSLILLLIYNICH